MQKDTVKQYSCILCDDHHLYLVSMLTILDYRISDLSLPPRVVQIKLENLSLGVKQENCYILPMQVIVLGGSFEVIIVDISEEQGKD